MRCTKRPLPCCPTPCGACPRPCPPAHAGRGPRPTPPPLLRPHLLTLLLPAALLTLLLCAPTGPALAADATPTPQTSPATTPASPKTEVGTTAAAPIEVTDHTGHVLRLEHPALAASYLLHGQIGLLGEHAVPLEERVALLRRYAGRILEPEY